MSLGTTDFAAQSLLLAAGGASSYFGNSHLIDLAVDVGGTKYIVVPDFVSVTARDAPAARFAHLPLALPAGVEVFARAEQAQSASPWASVEVALWALQHGWMGLPGSRGMESVGVVSGTTAHKATAISGHASANTLSAWTSLGTAAAAWRGLLWGIWPDQSGALGESRNLVDLGIDPAGGTSFSVIAPQMYFMMDSSGDDTLHGAHYLPIQIPAGASIGVRYQSSVAGETIYSSVHGVLQ